ncbi:PKD domain-containing protein [Gaoshiqia sediminis]|uniref:PKD domain-containing protein n=1 Tax=Gaoshiqia sediminis TaxID=2986998 RepID=A0AA42C6D1_9BACT|nr:PKD domain-containing protein [Gaoshiqia sediminis]MCW0483783.1 PKD domain-containing protein [Gaoshiqia sediminis]
MRSFKYLQQLTGMAALFLALFACSPEMDDSVDIGAAPTEDQLDFTIAPGANDFKFVLTNTSSVTGIVSWDLGNGSKSSAASPVATYPLPGDYTITMTLITKGGMATKSRTLTQTKTDYSIFTDEKFILLSGGADDLDGKTWVLDSLASGHLGVGPAGTPGLEWWAAAPLAKQAVKVLYDDEINFKVTGFVATLTNHGKSYVKGFVNNSPGYSNPVEIDTDFSVDYVPSPGTWFIEENGGKNYLTLGGPTPMFPIFDVGAANGSYEILKLEENLLELVAIGGDGNAWHYQLIPKGYVKPTVTTELSVVAAAETNTYDVSLTNFNIPDGQAITGVTFNFGEGDPVSSTDYTAVASHTYMRQGTYSVSAVVTTSVGDLNLSYSLVVDANHPDYVPFLLDEMVMYNDFSEIAMAPVLGEDCSVTTVTNPAKIYPNRSSNVAFYSKTEQEWANANLTLPPGYRFDLRLVSTFKIMVYGKAGDVVLLKLENTDKGGNAWQTGVELRYTIQADNTWEVAEYNFAGAPTADLSWDPGLVPLMASDVTTDDRYNHDYYNIVRIMLNPGNKDVGVTHEFYFDELSGPHVEGIKSAKIN